MSGLITPHRAFTANGAGWLAVTGAAMVAVLAQGAAAGTDMAPWEREARQRIAEHRVSPLEVKVVTGKGEPAAGAQVSVEMLEHAFRFGTAVSAPFFVHETNDAHPYRKHLVELFNQATLENSLKWRLWERKDHTARRDFHGIRRGIEALLDEIINDPGRELGAIDFQRDADETIAWLRERDFTIRGHAMVYATLKHGALLPSDVLEALGAADRMSPETYQPLVEADETLAGGLDWNEDAMKDYVRDRVEGHIRNIGETYEGRIEEWDVINEHMSEYELTGVLNPDAFPVKAPEQVAWLKTAAEAAPDAALFINDDRILTPRTPERRDLYELQAEFLLEQGAPLDGIGFQGHFYGKEDTPSPRELWNYLERFAELGPTLAVTEFGMYGDWGESRIRAELAQAEFLYTMLLILYSHPAATGFTMWGFWDGQHWQGSAPLFREDWSEKPALHVYRDLVFEEWFTTEEGKADEDGQFSTEGHHGRYAITVRCEEHEIATEFRLTPDSDVLLIHLPNHL